MYTVQGPLVDRCHAYHLIGDVVKVKKVQGRGVDPNFRGLGEFTCLMVAAVNDRVRK